MTDLNKQTKNVFLNCIEGETKIIKLTYNNLKKINPRMIIVDMENEKSKIMMISYIEDNSLTNEYKRLENESTF